MINYKEKKINHIKKRNVDINYECGWQINHWCGGVEVRDCVLPSFLPFFFFQARF